MKSESATLNGPDTHRQLRDWYTETLGSELSRLEQQTLDCLLPDLFGYHILQIDTPNGRDLLATSRIPHRVVAASRPGLGASAGLFARPDALPIAADTLDALVLPHTLEFEANPHQVLREADRVLIPEGHLVIIGFNPRSLWGMRRLLRLRRCAAPWSGRFLSLGRLKDWLALLGFDIVQVRGLFHRPPVRHEGLLRRLHFFERLGARWLPQFGGAYVLVARKRVATLTPLKPRWRPRRSLVAAGLAEPTRRGYSRGR